MHFFTRLLTLTPITYVKYVSSSIKNIHFSYTHDAVESLRCLFYADVWLSSAEELVAGAGPGRIDRPAAVFAI